MHKLVLGGLAALILAAPALAAPDGGAVSTAGDTDELISEWLKAPPPAALEPGAAPAEAPLRDNKVHGEIGVGIGTGGYREAYGVADIPLGDRAAATVAVRDVQGRVWGGDVHSRSFGLSLAFGDAARARAGPPACADLRPGRYLEPLWVTRMRAGRPGLAGCPAASPAG
jgi:hypothetical protein